MPIMLTRKDGPPTPFRNAEYIPFYYFIPKSILSRCGAELNAIPRNPQELFHNRAACEFVESDLFRLLIIRCHRLYGLAVYGLRRVYGNLLWLRPGVAVCPLPGLLDSRADGRRHLWRPPANYSKVATRNWGMYRNGRSTSICATLCPM